MTEEINTHNLIINFGKHNGKRWTRVPANYLMWLVNEPTDNPEWLKHKDVARAELKRRGSLIRHDVEISNHAIDTASLRVRKTWHETAIDDKEGLYSWLARQAEVAVSKVADLEEKPDRVIHLGIKWVFKWGNEFPILKTVMPQRRRRHERTNS